MLTNYGISPWSDSMHENYPLELQEVALPKTQPLKQSVNNKLMKLSEKFLTDNQFVAFHKKNKKKLTKLKENQRKLSQSISNYDSIQKSQISLSIDVHVKKKMSTELFQPTSRFYHNHTSQRPNFNSIHTSTLEQRGQYSKKPLLTQSQTQNLPYFFSLIQKQNIKFTKQDHHSNRYSRTNNQDIFKSLDQISLKKKKQIKLPKITVGYLQVQKALEIVAYGMTQSKVGYSFT